MLTKRDFKELDKRFITKKYFDSKSSLFVTKEYLDKKLNIVKEGLLFYFDERLKPIEKKLISLDDFKDKVLDRLDWLIGQYKKLDESNTILSGRYSEVLTKVNNHEKRITVLESKSTV